MSKIFKFKPNLDEVYYIPPVILKTGPGIYYTQITDGEISETKNGSPLLKLILNPYNFNFECLLSLCVSLNPLTHKYFNIFCQSIGLEYPENGALELGKLIGRSGFVKYRWQPDFDWVTDKDNNKKYLMAEHFVKPCDAYVQFREK